MNDIIPQADKITNDITLEILSRDPIIFKEGMDIL
jgi:hypothetical protein